MTSIASLRGGLPLAARTIRTRTAPSIRPTALAVRWSHSIAVGPLAFDLHEPARPKFDAKTSPILFLHGLFGSKKNNRAISK